MDDGPLTWEQVKLAHGTPRRAVKIDGGLVRSVLCSGRGQHSDEITFWKVKYSLPRRQFYEHAVDAFRRTLAAGSAVRVYEKLRQNEWLLLGDFKVTEVLSERHEHSVIMTRVGPDALPES
jgi:hypothetical protein